jgi:hypothetical protein
LLEQFGAQVDLAIFPSWISPITTYEQYLFVVWRKMHSTLSDIQHEDFQAALHVADDHYSVLILDSCNHSASLEAKIEESRIYFVSWLISLFHYPQVDFNSLVPQSICH